MPILLVYISIYINWRGKALFKHSKHAEHKPWTVCAHEVGTDILLASSAPVYLHSSYTQHFGSSFFPFLIFFFSSSFLFVLPSIFSGCLEALSYLKRPMPRISMLILWLRMHLSFCICLWHCSSPWGRLLDKFVKFLVEAILQRWCRTRTWMISEILSN